MSFFHSRDSLHKPANLSPAALSPGGTLLTRPRSRSTSSTQLQSDVESERAEVLSDVREAQSSQFGKLDSLSQRLESTTSYAMDMFKRDLPATVASRQASDASDSEYNELASTDIVVSSPTSSLPASSHTLSGKVLPVDSVLKGVSVADTATNEELSTRPAVSLASSRPSAISTATVLVSEPRYASDERQRSSDYLPVRSTVSTLATSSPRTPPSRNSASPSSGASPRLVSSELLAVSAGGVAADSVRRNSLSELHEQVSQRVSAVDSMAQQLEAHSNNAQDLFKRNLPSIVALPDHTATVASFQQPSASAAAITSASSGGRLATSGVLVSSPTSATLSAASRLPAGATLTSTLTTVDKGDTVVVRDMGTSMVAEAGDSTTQSAMPSASVVSAPVAYSTSAYPSKEDDATPEQQIQQLSLALIQAKQAYSDLLSRLYSSPTGTSLLGADTRPVDVTPSSLLSTVGSDDRSLQSFLHDLPVQRGWLVRRRPATANVPASVERVFGSLSFDGLLLSADESGENAEKIELAQYWLVERAADRTAASKVLASSASSNSSYSAAPSASAFSAPTSPVAGQSYFRLENGSYVLRLVPIVASSEQPQTAVEPRSSAIVEFMGASDADVAQADTLSQWCNCINLRISLLSLLASPNHSNLLAQGGREVLAFLCDVNSAHLLLENKYVNVSELLAYFKEPLLHRRDFSLVLRNVAMDDSGARILSELLLLNSHVQHVDISQNALTDVAASYLAMALPSNDGLIGLCLDNNSFTDDGVLELATAIAASTSLTSLSFRGLRLTDSTFASMIAALQAGTPRPLAKFDVAFNRLSDTSAPALGELLRTFGVGSLNLSHNEFGDALLPAIDSSLPAESSSRAMLAVLDVSFNRLTSTSPAALSSLLNTTGTLSINLGGNALTPSSVVSLLTAGVEVAVDGLIIHRGEEAQAAAGERPLQLSGGRRLSITKQSAVGRVDEIDPLHPRSDAQLGRSLDELSALDKSNATSEATGRPLTSTQQVRGVEKELLAVPSTAAATELLVDGGKTADPRMI